MNGYIKKQALMDYCSNQVTRTIDLNDIARFPISEVFTKDEVIAMFTEMQLEIEEKKFLESSCSFMDKTEEKNYAVYTDEISKIIQHKINSLKEDKK